MSRVQQYATRPDLSYKQLKSIILFQELFKIKRKIVYDLNQKMNTIYSTLVSISNNINSNYINGVIDADQYRSHLEVNEKLTDEYAQIESNITIRTLSNNPSIRYKISYLHYHVCELVRVCGASSCYDVFRIFAGDDWDLAIDPRHERMLKLCNTMFVPVLVKTSTVNIRELKVLKYPCYTESMTLKIHGAELIVPLLGKSMTIKGYFRDDPLNTSRIRGTLKDKQAQLLDSATEKYNEDAKLLTSYIQQISLRDFLSLDHLSLVNLIGNDLKTLGTLKNKPKGHVIEEFLRAPPKKQYNILTLLLLHPDTYEHAQAIITTVNTQSEKTINNLYRTLHWSVQKTFDLLVSQTDKQICIDESVLPYETRINNMKASDAIKNKAKDKLKEIKGSKEGNEKAKRYLDGLLRIPFGQYRKEKIIRYMSDYRDEIDDLKFYLADHLRSTNTSISSSTNGNMTLSWDDFDDDNITTGTPKSESSCTYVDELLKNLHQALRGKYTNENQINKLLADISEILKQTESQEKDGDINPEYYSKTKQIVVDLDKKWLSFKQERKTYLDFVGKTLENCIYGQDEAKRNIESIVAQWINGDMTGVVFGFQGFPGTGKTTLAKQGIAKCLVDADGNSRPFYFTGLGGARGSGFLLGHGYTYVGSQPGKLAEYVQDAKIMNPILYFDELDKVSSTHEGEEIIRILTHLLDPEQSDHIEDRYFGVEMDLSKALIILSYNDSSVIDRILMDRIHEINFKQYNRKEKTEIAKKYILPRICITHGFEQSELLFSDDLLGYIIEHYTCEAGVRDMKDKLTEIVREINLRRIVDDGKYTFPYEITEELADEILKAKNKIHITKIPSKPQIGWINGLYATNIGTGGITVIQAVTTPSDQKYSLELTGKLGDVMKESVTCAKTISWTMFKDTDMLERVNKEWRDNGLHIHFPAAGTSKDGPSAGAAITTGLISYFSKKAFRNYMAMTGEIDLHGSVRRIGGLQCKIEGALRAGVKIVLIPRKNELEYREFQDEYPIKVFPVDNISQVIRTTLVGVSDKTFNYPHQIKKDPVVREILAAIKEIEG